MTIFAVKKGTDSSFLWKATVRIACVKCDPTTKHIESYNLLNLKQFLTVFNTFQSHLEVMLSCEEQHEKVSFVLISLKVLAFQNRKCIVFFFLQKRQLTRLLDNVTDLKGKNGSDSNAQSDTTECCICLDRKPNLILPCTHVFCSTCIEQWYVHSKVKISKFRFVHCFLFLL